MAHKKVKNTRNKERVSEPPDYRKSDERYPDGTLKPNRRLRTSPSIRRSMRNERPAGGPRGRIRSYKKKKQSGVDPAGQWAPGEFQRSYPKNKKNAEWYRTHSYGRRAGDDYDSWRRISGPPTPKGNPKPRKGPGDWHAEGKKMKKPPRSAGAARMLARAVEKGKKNKKGKQKRG